MFGIKALVRKTLSHSAETEVKNEIIQMKFDIKTGYLISRVNHLYTCTRCHLTDSKLRLPWAELAKLSLGIWYRGCGFSLYVHVRICGLFPLFPLHPKIKYFVLPTGLPKNSCLNHFQNTTLIKDIKEIPRVVSNRNLEASTWPTSSPTHSPAAQAFLEGTHCVHIRSDDG